MGRIEELRNNLHIAIDKGDRKKILSLSRRLDKLILCYMKAKRLGKVKEKSRI